MTTGTAPRRERVAYTRLSVAASSSAFAAFSGTTRVTAVIPASAEAFRSSRIFFIAGQSPGDAAMIRLLVALSAPTRRLVAPCVLLPLRLLCCWLNTRMSVPARASALPALSFTTCISRAAFSALLSSCSMRPAATWISPAGPETIRAFVRGSTDTVSVGDIRPRESRLMTAPPITSASC